MVAGNIAGFHTDLLGQRDVGHAAHRAPQAICSPLAVKTGESICSLPAQGGVVPGHQHTPGGGFSPCINHPWGKTGISSTPPCSRHPTCLGRGHTKSEKGTWWVMGEPKVETKTEITRDFSPQWLNKLFGSIYLSLLFFGGGRL